MKTSRSYSLVCLVAVSLLSMVSSYAQEKHLLDTVKSKEGLRSNGGLGPMPYHYISSQDNIVMPAPDVAKMTRYADTPVSYAIGLPEISLPIHTIQSRSLNLPVTLTYDASGIKPGEISGIAGLGWSCLLAHKRCWNNYRTDAYRGAKTAPPFTITTSTELLSKYLWSLFLKK